MARALAAGANRMRQGNAIPDDAWCSSTNSSFTKAVRRGTCKSAARDENSEQPANRTSARLGRGCVQRPPSSGGTGCHLLRQPAVLLEVQCEETGPACLLTSVFTSQELRDHPQPSAPCTCSYLILSRPHTDAFPLLDPTLRLPSPARLTPPSPLAPISACRCRDYRAPWRSTCPSIARRGALAADGR